MSLAGVPLDQPGPRMRELLERDRRRVRDVLLEDANDYLDSAEGVAKSRYLSAEFQARETETVWSRTWQMACRLEQIPNAGDYVLYEVAGRSLIIVRTGPSAVAAYYNACPHRGRTMCEAQSGHVSNFRCKFHGMMWRLDGSCGHIPSDWDFSHVDREAFVMPQARTAIWKGFVFVNLDPAAGPFEAYIGDLEAHAAGWDFEGRYIAAHVGLVIGANWKVVTEAFIEDYHSNATHPQVLAYVNSAATQFTARKDQPHLARLLFAMAVPSPIVAADTSEERIFERMREDMCLPGEETLWTFDPQQTARAQVAEIFRSRMSMLAGGRDFSDVPESELLDNWVYHLFPSLFLFGGMSSVLWRVRPWGNDPGQSFMEVMLMLPLGEGADRPPPAPMTMLEAGRKFSDAPELGFVGRFMDQDLGNLEWVQRGLQSTPAETCVLARYQESLVRHFHRTIDLYLDGRLPVRP